MDGPDPHVICLFNADFFYVCWFSLSLIRFYLRNFNLSIYVSIRILHHRSAFRAILWRLSFFFGRTQSLRLGLGEVVQCRREIWEIYRLEMIFFSSFLPLSASSKLSWSGVVLGMVVARSHRERLCEFSQTFFSSSHCAKRSSSLNAQHHHHHRESWIRLQHTARVALPRCARECERGINLKV